MRVEELLQAHDFAGVLEHLGERSDPNSRAIRAFAYAFRQGEDTAAALIADLPFEGLAEPAHRILATHFASRADLTSRLNVHDPVGKKWAKHYRGHPDFRVQNKLSAVLIVKNEAKQIERCLLSVSRVADEIVLVDTGSTDDTVKIAKSLGLNLVVGHFEWCDDFASARNAALELATGDWALWIDADEELTPESFGDIQQAKIRPHFGGFHVRIVNFTGENGDESTYTHAPVRLFRCLPEIRFTGRVHEQIADSIMRLQLPIANLQDAQLLHYGYLKAEMEARGKYDRFISLLEREVRDDAQSAFQWFNLANAYTVCGRLTEAEHAARNAVRLSVSGTPYLDLAYQLLANSLTLTDRADEALVVLEEAEDRGHRGLFTEYERACAYMRLGKLDLALEAIDRSLAYGWEGLKTGDQTLFLFKRHVTRGQILALLGQPEAALEMYDYALAKNPGYLSARYIKGATLASMGRAEEAIPYFEASAGAPELRALSLTGLGRAYSALKRYADAAATFEKAWIESPTDYDSWVAWITACEASQDLETVVRAYSAFAKTNEPTPEILVNWGRALERAGEHQRALDCFEEALQRAPEDPNGYFNCGDLLFRCGQFQDAAHLYEMGLRLRPDHAAGWFVLGNSLAQMGLAEGAKVAYDEALRLDPTLSDAAKNLELISEVLAA